MLGSVCREASIQACGCFGEFEVVHPDYIKVKIIQPDGIETAFGKCVIAGPA